MALRGLGEEGVGDATTNHNYHRLCQSRVVSMQYLVAQMSLASSILTPCWRGWLKRRERAGGGTARMTRRERAGALRGSSVVRGVEPGGHLP